MVLRIGLGPAQHSSQVDLLWNCFARIALEFGLSGPSFVPGPELRSLESWGMPSIVHGPGGTVSDLSVEAKDIKT